MANDVNDKELETLNQSELKKELSISEQTEVMQAEATKQTVLPAKKKRKGANKIKGTASELKKVTWPSFGTVVKNTVVVLSITAVFLLVILGIDQLLYLLYNLLTKNM